MYLESRTSLRETLTISLPEAVRRELDRVEKEEGILE